MSNTRIPDERHFVTSDNTELFFRHWPATAPGATTKVIVMFHRGHEHSGRLQHIVDELAMPDTAFYAGCSWSRPLSGQRGYSPSLARSVQDVEEFVRFAAADSHAAMEDVVIVAQSVGAVLAATWAHDYAPAIRGLVLASPAFKVKLYVPFARLDWR